MFRTTKRDKVKNYYLYTRVSLSQINNQEEKEIYKRRDAELYKKQICIKV